MDQTDPPAADPGTFDPTARLTRWWAGTSEQDAKAALGKATEYGQLDLEIMGVAMAGLMAGTSQRAERVRAMTPEQRRQLGVEMALAFYNLGKVARAFGAYAAGRLPSDDTWHDATTYPMMARAVREFGDWVEIP